MLTTIGVGGDVVALARTLVGERLAACVNLLPAMTSVYAWKGTVEVEQEQQIVMKTTAAALSALEARLRELHPYELPEFVVLRGTASAAYAAWVGQNTAG